MSVAGVEKGGLRSKRSGGPEMALRCPAEGSREKRETCKRGTR